jgi:DNA-binding NarL/FixJ family response regulator/class 3 adenylate cyclase
MGTDFPSGTVTFLFTDIENSTRLWEQYPEQMPRAQARHDEILREAIETNGGYVFRVSGDAFCAAFHHAGDAIRAAVKSQIVLSSEDWQGASIRVRMGIHTGKADIQPTDGSYSGYLTLTRVQRLMSAGHGGQVLVSFAAQELLHDDLPSGVHLKDMGQWRFKNLSRPEHVFQLLIPGLQTDFPAINTSMIKDAYMSAIRILIADDHALFREGMRALLSSLPHIEVVGEAADGEAAIQQVDDMQPDVVLMDINMPKVNGIEATRRVLSAHPTVGIIIVTMLEDDASVFAAMRAGARGYILKGAHHDEMLQAIQAVAAGQAVFGPGIATRMVNFFQGLEATPRLAGTVVPFPELTEREREILGLIASGVSNKEITDRLVISPKTVSNHITNIFSKLQVADRAQAIVRARDAGMG